MRSISKIVSAVCLALSGTTAQAANWVSIGGDTLSAIWFVDSSSIRKSGQTSYIWVMADHSADTAVSYKETKNYYKVDWSSWRLGILSLTRYGANGAIADE